MPSFGDDLYLGSARLTPGDPLPAPGATPQQGGFGVGPLGRVYVWDTVPLALNAANIVASAIITGTAILTAGTGATAGFSNRGEPAIILDVPRAVQVVQAGGGTVRVFTVTGYDVYGQRMSEDITSIVGTPVSGKKAFKQIISVTVPATTTTAATVGTTDVLGAPVRFTDFGYIYPKWAGVLAPNAGTPIVADAAAPTSVTGDVRGTYLPTSATDGARRLVMAILVPAIAAGPNANRIGGYGVDQNLAAS